MIETRGFARILLLGTCLLSSSSIVAATGGVRHVNERVPNSYIVMLRSGEHAQDLGQETAGRYAGKLTAVMPNLDMFAVTLPNDAAAEAVARDPRVLLVQENAVLHLADCRDLDSSGSQWALAHLNDPNWTTIFGANVGNYLNWVSVWVIDTYINPYSSDFAYPNGGNKIRNGPDFSGGCGDNGGDHPPFAVGGSYNHGGAVASIIAGNVHGIVPNLNAIYSVVAANCLGQSSDSALSQSADYVIANYQPGTAAVANISITASFPDAIFDAAVQRMVNKGIFVAAAAGNDSTDACSTSPAELGGSAERPVLWLSVRRIFTVQRRTIRTTELVSIFGHPVVKQTHTTPMTKA